MIVTQQCECTKCKLKIAKMVNFMLCVFYHSCAQLNLIPCDPMDCNPPGSSVNGILQVRILTWVVMHSSRGSSRPREPASLESPALADKFFTATWEGPLPQLHVF
ncbi:unnamed protein product [Rangifer tarandus platyrhynchus]|uniref:Uncharacterized protein n=1 Tax=Rangifer tarandus platyrhynchus TaxID=3082113 RepID=A0ABN8ZY15_RANTA|nr:unnamed protein product [Rangifer tarandus platyrhynchus]